MIRQDEASASKKRAAPEPEAEAEAAAEADKGEKKKGKKPRTEEVAEEAGEGPVGGDVDLGALIKKIVKKVGGPHATFTHSHGVLRSVYLKPGVCSYHCVLQSKHTSVNSAAIIMLN